MVIRFPEGNLPHRHTPTYENKIMEVEGPMDDTFRGCPAKRYLVFDADSATKGYVYYHAESQEFLGQTGGSTMMIINNDSKVVSEATI